MGDALGLDAIVGALTATGDAELRAVSSSTTTTFTVCPTGWGQARVAMKCSRRPARSELDPAARATSPRKRHRSPDTSTATDVLMQNRTRVLKGPQVESSVGFGTRDDFMTSD